jgi:hypothetical protein
MEAKALKFADARSMQNPKMRAEQDLLDVVTAARSNKLNGIFRIIPATKKSADMESKHNDRHNTGFREPRAYAEASKL